MLAQTLPVLGSPGDAARLLHSQYGADPLNPLHVSEEDVELMVSNTPTYGNTCSDVSVSAVFDNGRVELSMSPGLALVLAQRLIDAALHSVGYETQAGEPD